MAAAERLVGVVCGTWCVACCESSQNHTSHITHHTSHVTRHTSHTNKARVSSTSAPMSVTSSTGVRLSPLSDNPHLQPLHRIIKITLMRYITAGYGFKTLGQYLPEHTGSMLCAAHAHTSRAKGGCTSRDC